ncbi:DUF2894 domain-containing protein [Marinobacter goseongensis]|jgi:hypothetical protein|uniref:DUF2894 domain-containing protein n=1 Tax=Marinobacter goseongensis TaxID=453838 RepID=UPI002004F893|nr:DUF2894 domain-containing protein [Marinobacter goseongensis]MCK7551034.1 DUF2894 domain-containing protein [Marinobacter goseongensis]
MTDVTEPEAIDQLLADLKQAGKDQMDPIRFRYLEVLEHRLRAKGLQGSRHWQKLAQAVAEYQARSEQQTDAQQPELPGQTGQPSPLQRLLDALNYSAEIPATNAPSPLESLIFGEETGEASQSIPANRPPRPLKAMARAQADRGHEALHKRIRQAIEQTPENAGPMNAHRLVSRAIATMETLSPEYLNRFVNYADTLLALERLAKKG